MGLKWRRAGHSSVAPRERGFRWRLPLAPPLEPPLPGGDDDEGEANAEDEVVSPSLPAPPPLASSTAALTLEASAAAAASASCSDSIGCAPTGTVHWPSSVASL